LSFSDRVKYLHHDKFWCVIFLGLYIIKPDEYFCGKDGVNHDDLVEEIFVGGNILPNANLYLYCNEKNSIIEYRSEKNGREIRGIMQWCR